MSFKNFLSNLTSHFKKKISHSENRENISDLEQNKIDRLDGIELSDNFTFDKSTNYFTSYEKKSKKKDLQEEYKILQSKIDTYSSAMLRFRGLMLSLISAVIAYKINYSQNYWIAYPILILLIIYFSYYEYLTKKATMLFESRLISIEKALKIEKELFSIDIYEIGKISSQINSNIFKIIKNKRDRNEIFKRSLIGFLILIPVFFTEKEEVKEKFNINNIYNFTSEYNKEQFDIYSEEYRMKENKNSEIYLELKKINNKIDKSSSVLNNLDNHYYESIVDK